MLALKRMCLLICAALTACVPELHGVVGKACDDANPCPDSLYCVDGACSQTPAPDVTVFTATFETGTDGFDPLTGARAMRVTTSPHQGTGSLRVGAGESSNTFGAQTASDRIEVARGRYCATAWVQHGTAATGPIVLMLRGYAGTALAASSDASAPAAQAALPSGSKPYQSVKTELLVDDDAITAITVGINCSSAPPAEVFLDDVTVIRTAGTCP